MTALLTIFVISKLLCGGCICAQDPSASLRSARDDWVAREDNYLIKLRGLLKS